MCNAARTLLLAVMALACVAARAEKHPKVLEQPSGKVGVAMRVFHPRAQRNWRQAKKQELRVTVWYPAVASAVETQQVIGSPDTPFMIEGSASPNAELQPSLRKLPLIVLSHGTGGSAAQMAWLGTALARAGFIAAAVDHPGNNSTEDFTAEGFMLWWERATDLSEVIDGMLADDRFGAAIDADRIGAAGFSLGGYTVMELAGARTDVSVLYDDCRQKSDQTVCHVPEMRRFGSPAEMLAAVRKTSGESLARSAESYRDARVHAVFAIAPAVAEVLTPESLHQIRIPVELVVGASDPIAPPKANADYIRATVRGARETVLPGGVAHYTFLDTCTAAGKARLGFACEDAAGVDRDAVHAQVAGMAVKFFLRELDIR